MGLQRKKVTVRTKRGKVYQRSMMVQAQAIGRRAGKSGKLNALNPWDIQHTEHVKINSALGARAKAYGSSGPGSDHSWLALVVGGMRQNRPAGTRHDTHEPFTAEHAAARRAAGHRLAETFGQSQPHQAAAEIAHSHGVPEYDWSSQRQSSIAEAFGVHHSAVTHVRHAGWGHRS